MQQKRQVTGKITTVDDSPGSHKNYKIVKKK